MAQLRSCDVEDFPAVLALLCQLWPDEPRESDALRAAFRCAVASQSHVALCATEGGRLIGLGTLTIRNSLWQAGYIGHVEELVVDREHRRQGIGTRLLEELVAQARQRGCSRIELDSALHRHEAHRFYERHGFENRAYVFSKQL